MHFSSLQRNLDAAKGISTHLLELNSNVRAEFKHSYHSSIPKVFNKVQRLPILKEYLGLTHTHIHMYTLCPKTETRLQIPGLHFGKLDINM